jgi:hypothetical protein
MSMKRLAAYICVLICGVAIGYWFDAPADYQTGAAEAAVAAPAPSDQAPRAFVRPASVGTGGGLEKRREFAPVPLSEPALHARLRPVLNRGTNLEIAAAEFRTAADFAAVAHAARSTQIPFMVLKHQIVNEGKSLEAAIHAVKPEANAAIEADLALAKAHADLAAIAGN